MLTRLEVELYPHSGIAFLGERSTLIAGNADVSFDLLGAREIKDLLEVAGERLELLAEVGAPEPFALHEGG